MITVGKFIFIMEAIMATSSFTKDFTLNSKQAVKSFAKIISKPVKSEKIDRSVTSPKNQEEGIAKLRTLSII